ncbi:crossover junction endodeoxyribonuclease RuvC [Fluviispira multicolorata]|uniref:crossover junction endodeoxyribonuclease n=1 Tax=Fluviispira multicolorata TaxID=2654512 RepID=A0A833N6A2_9BACT|nr:crossover junction endodeoxyribonuclease RuvC [Fluviispira multicolorata]KAB8033145.1 crossover junction endodeoxyribonuclease RuvC [Fluviispira multicolorata]
MRIIGIDPGTRIAGYGVVDLSEQKNLKAIAAGAWKLDAQKELPPRLATLAIEFRRVVETYKPSHICLELSFLADNPRTALFLGHARGVILSEAHQLGLVISEISATSAKKIISGNGRAEKSAIAKIMSSMLGFNFVNLPYDATDALAIACADAMRNRNSSFANSSVTLESNSSSNENILIDWQKKRKKGRIHLSNFASLLKAK